MSKVKVMLQHFCDEYFTAEEYNFVLFLSDKSLKKIFQYLIRLSLSQSSLCLC